MISRLHYFVKDLVKWFSYSIHECNMPFLFSWLLDWKQKCGKRWCWQSHENFHNISVWTVQWYCQRCILRKEKNRFEKNTVTKSHYRNFAWYLDSSVSVLTFWGAVQCSSILANLDCKKLMNFESHQTVKCILYINQYSMMFQTSEEVDGSDVWVHNLRNSLKNELEVAYF